MRFIVSYAASISDQELLEAGVDITNKFDIQDYFYDMGGEESFHDHGLTFEILKDS